ncbi:sugar ABC transporter substrate-binding protein [Pseudoalteromonas phenolica]|uniref:Sugar ABC transporter substrate-binding protein n=1 Tax=Pseudoalteromonas phenolica TaxID=161398 RepID=A0A5R9Q022_9GAMM|nr:substrate-binding domain-containing protein [Pseudoalteromonas phenolica]TLX46503.1 sugar ABC transporter substrate-binding protein [Pseudoalteromonas phenolica]
MEFSFRQFIYLSICVFSLFCCTLNQAYANEQFTIAVIGKTKNDSFYEQSFKGCLNFASKVNNLKCIYDGADDYQDVRTQSLVINELSEQSIDAFLVSTTHSEYLVTHALKNLKKKNIPVITFDSDLLPKHQQYRLAYIGTNNFDFGVALGELAKKYKTVEKQSICLQSGHQTTPNLNARLAGVRHALSGQSKKRLSGDNGWVEHPRCPLYTMGKRHASLEQVERFSTLKNPPIFLAVAGFAQFNPDYIETMKAAKSKIADGNFVLISADTEQIQLDALKHGLSTVNLGQKPFEMGRKSTELMYNYLTQGIKPKLDKYYLDYHLCDKSNFETCTVNY